MGRQQKRHEFSQANQVESAPVRLADFRLEKRADGCWEIAASSARGHSWLSANFADALDDERKCLSFSLRSANDFLKAARASGYRTEYLGPNSVSYL